MPSLPTRALLALAAALSCIGLLAASASAATQVVTTTADTGAGSLRQAVIDASSGDTIVIEATGTIVLSTGQITIAKSLAIEGPGAASLTISGGGSTRLFAVTGANDVSFSGIRFLSGFAFNGGDGGAISSAVPEGSALTVTDCVFRGNESGSDGGAIAVTGNGGLVIERTEFTQNTAGNEGGAIAYASKTPIVIRDSVFTGNVADGSGGALTLNYNDVNGQPSVDSAEIANSTFLNNANGTGGGYGGAINMEYKTAALAITGSTFRGNRSTDGSYEGGAIRQEAVTSLSVDSSVFTDNAGGQGGAIVFRSRTNTASLTITDSLFEGNASASNGGAVYHGSDGPVTITGSVFRGNRSADSGTVAVAYNAVLTMSDSAIVDNTAVAGYSPGLFFTGDSATLRNVTIAGNVGNGSEAAAAVLYANTVLDGVTITGNVNPSGAAGIDTYLNPTISVSNSIIAGNRGLAAKPECEDTIQFTGTANSSILGSQTGCTVVGSPRIGDAGVGELMEVPTVDGAGTTWVVPLQVGSPAVDAGDTTLATDQRGVARPQGSAPDIGAMEMRAAGLGVTLWAPEKVGAGASATIYADVTNTGDFPTPSAALAIGLPSQLALGTTAVDCATAAGGAACAVGVLGTVETRTIEIPVDGVAAGAATVTATLAASGLASATASTAITVTGGAAVKPAGTNAATPKAAAPRCDRQVRRLRVGGVRQPVARVSCWLRMNDVGSYRLSFAKKRGGTWSIMAGSWMAGRRTVRASSALTYDTTTPGRRGRFTFLVPVKAQNVPLSVVFTSPSGTTTTQRLR